MLTSSSPFPAPSQALPDLQLQDSPTYPPRSASRLNAHADEELDGWDSTLRPINLELAASRSVVHSRESSIEKLPSGGGLAGIPESPRSVSSATSPGIRGAAPRAGIGGILERVVDPKAATYGHHRQTSIVHGIQHSRNGSASSSSSPLSPQMIAAAGAGFLPERPDVRAMSRLDSEVSLASRPPTALSGTTATSATLHALERTISADTTVGAPPRKLERMQSKSRREHAHQQSHSSRHHKDEQNTVGEYALHVLFTSVCPPLLLLCLLIYSLS